MADSKKTCAVCGNCLATPNRRGAAACAAEPIQGEETGGYADIDMMHFGLADACDKWVPRTERACRIVRDESGGIRCSECECPLSYDDNYCPTCGAKVAG